MPPDLSISNAPEQVVYLLRRRAERHHRSLEGELLALVEEAVAHERPPTVAEIVADIRQSGLGTPDDSTAIIRADRDRDEGH